MVKILGSVPRAVCENSRYLVSSSATASNALSAFFASPRWKSLKWKSQGAEWSYDFSEPEVRERLWQQAENMKPPSK